MFKNVIAPIQAWLLLQGRCVGCGTNLGDKGTKVTCQKCGRIFVKDSTTGRYRRALFGEV
jgi:DNA-directed RNA polymerase subunit RPC12/RpoP